MLLDELLQNFNENLPALAINNICLDSREIAKGDLFIAVKGENIDGKKFIEDAINKGAVAILVDENLEKNFPIPVIYIEDLATKISYIANKFYQFPDDELDLIGITGTNGKTTTSHLIAQALNLLDRKTAVLGTVGNGFLDKLQINKNTTESAVKIPKLLREFIKQDAKAVAMEVSSHALVQNRIKDLKFKIVIFTNITQDHLDYHLTMENYIAAKKQFLSYADLQILNFDDIAIKNFAKDAKHILSFAIDDKQADIKVLEYKLENGITAKIQTPQGMINLQSSLIGKFNLANLLATIATLIALTFDKQSIENILPKLKAPNGRMQTIIKDEKMVVVDYAHTPDALKQVLLSLNEHKNGKIWTVFGAGGDRDKTKRPIMAKIAEELSDFVIATSDNPRTEKAQSILEDIQAGFTTANYQIIENRKEAISFAIHSATENDIILIAGKGHENYQEINGIKHFFDDLETAKEILDY